MGQILPLQDARADLFFNSRMDVRMRVARTLEGTTIKSSCACAEQYFNSRMSVRMPLGYTLECTTNQ